MFWIILAISSHFFWALGNIGDKYIVGHRVKNPFVYLVWFTFTGIFVLLVIPFINFDIPPTNILLLLILAGAVYFFGGLPYIKAMQIEEPTRVNVWWNLIPLFSLFIGWVFLGEVFNQIQIFAFILLVTGAFIASIHARGKKIIFSKAVWYMMIACLSFTLYATIFRYCMRYISFTNGFVLTHLIMFGFSFILFFWKKFRSDFVYEIKHANINLLILVLVMASLAHFGAFLNQWALSLGPVALVFAMEGFQVIFVFAIATLLSLFLPGIVKEELDKKNILLKLTALSLMIIGILILAFN
ncbi:MAG: DMT family transporter [bacterium]